MEDLWLAGSVARMAEECLALRHLCFRERTENNKGSEIDTQDRCSNDLDYFCIRTLGDTKNDLMSKDIHSVASGDTCFANLQRLRHRPPTAPSSKKIKSFPPQFSQELLVEPHHETSQSL